MSLNDLRKELDTIDDQLLGLFEQRMDAVSEIARHKQASGLPVLDRSREAEKMRDISGKVRPEMKYHAHILFDTLFNLSKNHQSAMRGGSSALHQELLASCKESFPQSATVACPGVKGSFSQEACERIFNYPNIMHFKAFSFDKVFSAIENGLCDYGVLPLENSTTGLVGKIYDLMQNNYCSFRIVKSVRLSINHNLLAPKGVKLEDIREVFSHEQAIRQCAGFLEQLGPNVKITECENTSIAAEMVSGGQRRDVAAICSSRCVELYGLSCLASNIQDESGNYTRFICISKNLEIYPDANRTSVMMVVPNQPGSLYKALSRFYSLGINLTKLESRPLFEHSASKVMFYLDFELSPLSGAFARLLEDMRLFCEEFQYLGSYSEVE